MSLARGDLADLCAAREAIQSGQISAVALLDAALAINPPGTYIRRFGTLPRATASAVDALRAAGAPVPTLAGLAVSVKDLFDVAGFPTTGGSAALLDAPAATTDSLAVARLRAAGAALVGHTNLSEFAFSGVGINPHHGTPANPATASLSDGDRIPGGSSSGGAVSVTSGAAWAALGSDTGGSIRIPAALQGLVGFKNTQRLTPLDGCLPLSTSLDTACAVTRSVRDAICLHEVLSARRVRSTGRPLSARRFAVPQQLMLDDLEPAVASAFERALATLRAAGAQVETVSLPALTELSALNAKGGLPAAESWAWHRERLAARGDRYDPRVAIRIRRGEAMSAADYIDLLAARRDWIARVQQALAGFDAALSPTVPMVAPLVAPLIDNDDAFFATNARLLRNPAVVNFYDGCALSLPCHAAGTLPVGLMVWAAGGADDQVLEVSLDIERLVAPEAGV